MAAQFCTQKLEEYKKLVRLHSTFMLIYCVLNLTFSIVATIANVIVIRALWKASSIPGTLRKLFLSLAASDLAVGLLVQLIFGVVFAVMLKMAGNEDYSFDFFCPTILYIRYFSGVLLVSASFFTVTAIAVDRLLAISLHLRYQGLVTSTRVFIALVSLWLASGIVASIFIALPAKNVIIVVVMGFVGLIVTTVAYCRIYKVVRRHRTRIQACQHRVPDTTSMTFLREAKSAFSSFFFYVVFLVCYFPHICSVFLLMTDRFRISFLLAYYVSFFFMLLNSSLNPLVYCWRYREVRQIVTSMVKKIFCNAQTGP